MIRLVTERVSSATRPRAHVPHPPSGPGGKPSLADSYRYCEQFTRSHHENFPVASIFLPSRLRPHVFALYAFVRVADDIADESQYEGRRGEELDRWEALLERAWHGDADHPIFVALADTAQQFDLPITPLANLLQAFHMDLGARRYATWKDLESYLTMAASPIGHLLLYVFGVRDAGQHRFAEELAWALAMTNFWQDIASDLGRDRIYLPQEDLRHFGVLEDDLRARRESPALAALVRHACARTRAVFERAAPLVQLVPDQLGVEVALFHHGGRRALAKVEARAGHVFGPRVRLSAADKALVVAQALRARGSDLTSRL